MKYAKIGSITLIIVVLAVLGVVWATGGETYQFAGNLTNIDGNTVLAEGFLSQGQSLAGLDAEQGIVIAVSPKTKLTRLALKIPQGVATFNTADLEQEESDTDLTTITNDLLQGHIIGIQAVVKNNRFSRKFQAQSLYFRVPVFSETN